MTNYLEQKKNIFILGIKGVGMANLAVILKQMGNTVVGSDVAEHFITDELLESQNIPVTSNFHPDNVLDSIALFIYSGAHHGTQNAQAIEAKRKGIPVVSQTEILGELMTRFETSIAVSGCHGKTTTSSLLAYALEKLGADPSYFIGTSTFQDKWAGQFDEQKYFVVEADEYGVNPPIDRTPKFKFLKPTHILCLNVDFDHPDIYKDIEDTKKAFLYFFTRVPNPKLFLNEDSPELMDAVKSLPRQSYLTYGFSKTANFQIDKPIINEFFSEFELISKIHGKSLGTFQISLFGMHNISNAAGVIILLISLGFNVEDIKKAILNFSGAKRRFEKIAEFNDTMLFDDYAHHPEEIMQTILSAKARFADRRIIVIFQPHTFSRTNALKDDFIDALAHADIALLTPIFASAREEKTGNEISSRDLAELATTKGIQTILSLDDKPQLLESLKKIVRKGDIIFTFGAGDIYKMKNDIIELIKAIE